MSTWANSGLSHAALAGAMLALGRTIPPAAFGDRELPEPRRRGRPLPPTPPGRYSEEAGAGLRYLTSPAGPEAAGVVRQGVVRQGVVGQGVVGQGVVGQGVVGGSTRPVNPTDGFLAGSVTALAAAPIPVWDPEDGAFAAIGAWSDSGTLASVPVVPAPPMPAPPVSDLSPVSDASLLGSFASTGFPLESGGLERGGLERGGLEPGDGVEQVEPVVDSPMVDSSALGSLDRSGLFVALSRLPTSCR